MKRTLWSTNARNRATKSWFIGQLAAECPELQAETPRIQQAFLIGQLPPGFDVVAVGLSVVGVAADGDAAVASSSGHAPLSSIAMLATSQDVEADLKVRL